MTGMYTRSLTTQNHSFFLFGPRGVGKSSWVKKHYPKAHLVDLLQTQNFIKYQAAPQLFREDLLKTKGNCWVFVDEVQLLPILLNEVHSLIEGFGERFKFILTGSSARKLRRSGVNLLAGRARTEYLFPLTAGEMKKDFDLEDSLSFGNLPLSVNESADKQKIRFLESYVETYLKEEIQQEALVKNLSGFSRFLKIAALLNGQKMNLSAVSRDAAVSRSTAQGYFQILTDTLLGTLVQPLSLKFRVKEVDHPKFYFFDTGVVRTIQNQLRDEMDDQERGFLLETFILHELKAFNAYHAVGGEIYYWGTHDGKEVDFIFSRGKLQVGIEIKAGKKWRSEYGENLRLLKTANKIHQAHAIYGGSEKIQDQDVTVWPILQFISALERGEVIAY